MGFWSLFLKRTITPMHGCDDMYAARPYNAPDRRIGIYWLIDKTSEQIPKP